MALDGTYTGLKASIADWLDRSDLTSQIPDFITLFESNANTDPAFKSQFNRTYTTLTATANTATVSTPTDFLTPEGLILVNGGFNTPLVNYGTATGLYTANPSTTAGIPNAFLVLNGQVLLSPTPNSAYSLKLFYYQKIPALATNSANWLLTNYPQIYLFGALLASEAFLGNDISLSKWGSLYDNAVQKLQGATDRNKYSGGALTVKMDAVV